MRRARTVRALPDFSAFNTPKICDNINPMKSAQLQKSVIKTPSDRLFADFIKLYDASFPAYERRTAALHEIALSDPRYTQEVWTFGGDIAALNSYWTFPSYIFLEHYAVGQNLRGRGIGTRLLSEFVRSAGKPCILEIDPPVDEVSIRRLHFYERVGFKATPFYISQIYIPGYEDQKMLILSHPDAISEEAFGEFESDYKNIIMRKS